MGGTTTSTSTVYRQTVVQKVNGWNSAVKSSFLGGLSLHLNHLIASRVRNFDWQFGTLPFGIFWSNLDTMGLETYPRTYSGHFWHMSLFDDSRAVWVFSKNGWSQKIKVFSMKDRLLRGFAIQFSWAKWLGYIIGQFFFHCETLKGVLRAVESRVPLFWRIHEGLKGTYYWGCSSRICP